MRHRLLSMTILYLVMGRRQRWRSWVEADSWA
jgi:hypothetical protein